MEWITYWEKIVIAVIAVVGSVITGYWAKVGKDRYQLGQSDERGRSVAESLKDHRLRLEHIEGRVIRREEAASTRAEDVREALARISAIERHSAKIDQTQIDCRKSREEWIKANREFICLKIAELERRIIGQLETFRQSAKEEKQGEIEDLKKFIISLMEKKNGN